MFEFLLDGAFWISVAQIIAIDIPLGGDNAVVIETEGSETKGSGLAYAENGKRGQVCPAAFENDDKVVRKRAALDRLLAIAPALEAAGAEPMSEEEIAGEVKAAREERRAGQAAGPAGTRCAAMEMATRAAGHQPTLYRSWPL